KVETVPPPVPQVSTRWSPAASTGIIASRSARAAPATSSGVSPLTRRPMSRAAICAGVASPRITTPKTTVVWLSVSERRFATAAGWADGAGGFRSGAGAPHRSADGSDGGRSYRHGRACAGAGRGLPRRRALGPRAGGAASGAERIAAAGRVGRAGLPDGGGVSRAQERRGAPLPLRDRDGRCGALAVPAPLRMGARAPAGSGVAGGRRCSARGGARFSRSGRGRAGEAPLPQPRGARRVGAAD